MSYSKFKRKDLSKLGQLILSVMVLNFCCLDFRTSSSENWCISGCRYWEIYISYLLASVKMLLINEHNNTNPNYLPTCNYWLSVLAYQNPCHASVILFPEPTVMSSVKNLYLIQSNLSANPHTGEAIPSILLKYEMSI